MNIASNIIPITKARGKLGDLAERLSGEEYIILTKGGMPKVALVDVAYLEKLQKTVRSMYQKTYIDKKLLPYTRIFRKEEIEEWHKEDTL